MTNTDPVVTTPIGPFRRRRLGLALTSAGVVLVVVAGIVEIGGGLTLGALGNDRRAGSALPPFAAALVVVTSPTVILIALLVAACLLIPGEQLRRGNITANAQPPHTRLPMASNVSRFVPLGVGWHAALASLGTALSVVLVAIPGIASVTRTWPTTLADERYVFSDSWRLCGMVCLAISTASLVSLYKKVHYYRFRARERQRTTAGAAGSAGWAFVTYRWRLDLWVAGLGGLLAGFAGISVGLVEWGTDEDTGGAVDFVVVLLVVAAALVGFGIWLASHFWRAGIPLGSGESYS